MKKESRSLFKFIGVLFSISFTYMAYTMGITTNFSLFVFALPLVLMLPVWVLYTIFDQEIKNYFKEHYNIAERTEKIERLSAKQLSEEKPLAVVLVSMSDHNGVILSDFAIAQYLQYKHSLKGYNVVFKASSGVISEDLASVCGGKQASLCVLTGHGSSRGIEMTGQNYGASQVYRHVAPYVENGGMVVFDSCSTDRLARSSESVSKVHHSNISFVGPTKGIVAAGTYVTCSKVDDKSIAEVKFFTL